ncbi:MAG: beta-glucosidase BglX [Bacteroidota bacterium]
MKKIHFSLLKASIILTLSGINSCQIAVSQKSSLDRKVDSLLSIMTLEEKIGQTNLYNGNSEMTGPSPQGDNKNKAENIKNGLVGGMLNVFSAEETQRAQTLAVENSRLGIPLIFGYDVIHGYQTMFPIPLAQAASWDIEVAKIGSQVAAREAAAAGLHWTFAPMIDISRDARWGRIMESPGEDPYLASIMAKGWVEGFQGEDLASLETIAACAKHFAAYGYAEAGREYNTVDISMQTLYNVVLPPFQAANDAGAATFMNAFNILNGIPATGSSFLQRELLKENWGFDGFVVSDWASIPEMIFHGSAIDTSHAAELAIKAGSDMDMQGMVYEKKLKQKIEEGLVDVQLLDDAVRRILKIKYRLGLFDDPYRYSDKEKEKAELLSKKNLDLSREAAKKTFVLLKNKENILPLEKNLHSIAVIGQLANSKDVPLGSWRAQAITNSAVSVLEGIESAVPKTKVVYAQGYTLTKGDRSFTQELTIVEGDKSGFDEAIRLSKRSDLVVLVLGEDCFQSGEGRSQTDIALKGNQIDLIKKINEVNKNIVVVLMTGRPVPLTEVSENSKAILQTWFAGSEAGNAIADVLFGDFSPAGKLPVSFPYHGGQEPLYYCRKSTGRQFNRENNVFWSHYTDGPNDALYPFGYGLTYTTFEYSNLDIAKTNKGVSIDVDITNTGERAGTEVVQLYIRDVAASLARPIKELKGFQKKKIDKGKTLTIEFNLTIEDLSFYNTEGEKVYEPGEFEIMVGPDSKSVLSKKVTLE